MNKFTVFGSLTIIVLMIWLLTEAFNQTRMPIFQPNITNIITLPLGHKFHSLVFRENLPYIVTIAPDGDYHVTSNVANYIIKETK